MQSNHNDKNYIPIRSSPQGSSRGCLCKDKPVYSRECCTGDIMAQGIGNITRIT